MRFSVAAAAPVPDADRLAGFALAGMLAGATFASAVPSGDGEGKRSFVVLSLDMGEIDVVSSVLDADVCRG